MIPGNVVFHHFGGYMHAKVYMYPPINNTVTAASNNVGDKVFTDSPFGSVAPASTTLNSAEFQSNS